MNKRVLVNFISIVLILLTFGATRVLPQTTEFSYQGFITDNSASANGNFDFEFRLFDAATGGAVFGTIQRPNVTVTNGVFSVVLDFGAFPPANRFLEIAVRPSGGTVSTTLAPRSKILSSPFSTNAVNAANATNSQNAVNSQNAQNSLQLGGVTANLFVQTTDARLTDARNPLPNSPNYIQNSTAPQTSTNFNITGSGTAGGTLTASVVSAATQFNIGVSRVLSSPNSLNFFAGNSAGLNNTTGTGNSFFGINAGVFNTTGDSNAFFGFEAGRANIDGANNAYFGNDAGIMNSSGNDNSFFGKGAGRSNVNGDSNAFFGSGAGAANLTANNNSFFGASAGQSNTTAANNSFFGFESGQFNTTGDNNSFFGVSAGQLNSNGFWNSFFGSRAGGNNTIGGNNSFFGNLAGRDNTTGNDNSFFGTIAGRDNTIGDLNSFFGSQAGQNNSTGDNNTFFGSLSGGGNTTGSNNTLIGFNAEVGTSNLTNATAIGANAFIEQSNSLILGSVAGVNGATATPNVGIGTTTPQNRLHVNGIIRADSLGLAGSTSLCRNTSNQISTCSSSLRYKTSISPFSPGLNLVNRLRPITFNWKEGGMRDLGLGAEDVAAVEPLLVTYNEMGAVEGVKYDRVAVILLNAVKEQQEQIEQQRKIIEDLRRVVCRNNPRVKVCRSKQ